jgi:hypothetical protein
MDPITKESGMTNKLIRVLIIMTTGIIFAFTGVIAQEGEQSAGATIEETAERDLKPEEKLVVVWTSGDRDVALSMVFMYVGNAPHYGWWEDITFVIWGASSPLLAGDEELQGKIKGMAEAGIKLEACKACADMYGVGPKLEELGIDVKYMGDVLTGYIKEGRHILTF